jgi:hypothetical protein
MIQQLQQKIAMLEAQLNGLHQSMFKFVQARNNYAVSMPTEPTTSFAFITAICVSTMDIWKQNRIKFFSPLLHNPYLLTVEQLPWAAPVSSMGGFDDSGLTWIPPAGSTVCIIFEDGCRQSAYYLGTTWNRMRSSQYAPDNVSRDFGGCSIPEFNRIWEGNRTGYLVGNNTGAQVLPPWNTENYNGYDINDTSQIELNPEYYKNLSYPNIKGMKTEEKHMLKFVDGDPICNRKWKRIELMSSCGNWMCFKDDPLHYGGQWANPQCTPNEPSNIDISCLKDATGSFALQDQTNQSLQGSSVLNPAQQQAEARFNDAQNQLRVRQQVVRNLYNPSNQQTKEDPYCNGTQSNSSIIGGHPRYPGSDTQGGKNPFFKQASECRPYKGPETPQNNRCDLPQSGIQFLSISGHSWVMDDSVQQPQGVPNWQRGTKPFDYGCNDWYVGRSYWISSTGHFISLDDYEYPGKVRSASNGIFLRSALGNEIYMSDETLPSDSAANPAGQIAGKTRGISMQSTSKHTFRMIDDGNDNPPPVRKRTENGTNVSKATKAYVQLRTGYGLELLMSDGKSQEKTDDQALIMLAPQKTNPDMGPHVFEMRESAKVGLVYLRAGGQYIQHTIRDHYEIIGEVPENNLISDEKTADKVSIVSRNNVVRTYADSLRLSRNEIILADEKIILAAGKDCSDKNGDPAPCIGYPLVFMQTGPDSGAVMISDTIIMSVGKNAKTCSIACFSPFTEGKVTTAEEKEALA